MIDNYKDILIDVDVSVDTNKRVITVNTEMEDTTLYTWLKDLWMTSPNYIKFLFPMTSFQDIFGRGHISMTNEWIIIGIHKLTEAKKY
jgi:hypothetical protein